MIRSLSAVKTHKEILLFLQQNKSFLQEQFHLTRIGLFGSFAREEQHEKSDVDILFEVEEGTPDVHELKQSLRHYLSNAFGRDVDLAREKYLKPYAKEQILKEVIYAWQ